MDEGSLLTLEEAATHTGYRKRELRALVREGRLPAVRAGKRWQVAPSDLAMLPSRIAAPPEPQPPPAAEAPAVEASTDKSSEPMIALIELLRERDQKLTELLEERSQLTGQVGFLLGQLSEREERIQRLEQAALTAPAAHSVNVLPATSVPAALLDEWTTPSGDTMFSEPGSTADSDDEPMSMVGVTSAASSHSTERNDTAAIAGPDPLEVSAPLPAEPPADPPHTPPKPRRGLFGLFRRRASA